METKAEEYSDVTDADWLIVEQAIAAILDAEFQGARLVLFARSTPQLRNKAHCVLRLHSQLMATLANKLAEPIEP